jgi:two-component system, OmpR family, heavy metal sensor histidine kinase CusS
MFNSVRFKITLLFSVGLGLILLVYSSYLYFNLSAFVYYEVDKNLTEKTQEIEKFINKFADKLEPDYETTPVSLKRVIDLISSPEPELIKHAGVKELDQEWIYMIHTLALKRDYVIVYYPSGEVAEMTGNIVGQVLPVLRKNIHDVSSDKVFIKDCSEEDLKLRIITRPFMREGRLRYIIQLATPMDAVLFRIKQRFMIIFFTIPLVLVVTSVLVWILVVQILQPIADITQAAEHITHKDMSNRVGQTLADEEIVRLVDAFNNMISRLETSFKYIQEFSYDVAHELRTPLAIIRGEAEVALRRDRSADEYRQSLQVCLDETAQMLTLVEDLLLLTKLEYQADAIEFATLDLNEFMTEIYEQWKIIAEQKQRTISLVLPKRSKMIQANKVHLRRLFFNLIDNAVKFTQTNGLIDIEVAYENEHARILVADNGIGIADEDLPKILNRFYHKGTDSSTGEAGHGLGLSLAQSIAKVHQGSLEVKSVLGNGSTFIVILPVV